MIIKSPLGGRAVCSTLTNWPLCVHLVCARRLGAPVAARQLSSRRRRPATGCCLPTTGSGSNGARSDCGESTGGPASDLPSVCVYVCLAAARPTQWPPTEMETMLIRSALCRGAKPASVGCRRWLVTGFGSPLNCWHHTQREARASVSRKSPSRGAPARRHFFFLNRRARLSPAGRRK